MMIPVAASSVRTSNRNTTGENGGGLRAVSIVTSSTIGTAMIVSWNDSSVNPIVGIMTANRISPAAPLRNIRDSRVLARSQGCRYNRNTSGGPPAANRPFIRPERNPIAREALGEDSAARVWLLRPNIQAQ